MDHHQLTDVLERKHSDKAASLRHGERRRSHLTETFDTPVNQEIRRQRPDLPLYQRSHREPFVPTAEGLEQLRPREHPEHLLAIAEHGEVVLRTLQKVIKRA